MANEVSTHGPLVFVGGGEWREGAQFDVELLTRSDGEVLVLPTAAAFERPSKAIEQATNWFASLGGKVRPAMVLSRSDAEDPEQVALVRSARFIYLVGGSPLHLRSVLKDSAVLHALVAAWREGAVVVGSSAGAMALSDPMVDPRGGAFTVGLGLVRDLAVVPHHQDVLSAEFRRTLALSPTGCALVGVPETTALVREPDGLWRSAGLGQIEVYLDGKLDGLSVLAGKPIE